MNTLLEDLADEVVATGNVWVPVKEKVSVEQVIRELQSRGYNAWKGAEETAHLEGFGEVCVAEEVRTEYPPAITAAEVPKDLSDEAAKEADLNRGFRAPEDHRNRFPREISVTDLYWWTHDHRN